MCCRLPVKQCLRCWTHATLSPSPPRPQRLMRTCVATATLIDHRFKNRLLSMNLETMRRKCSGKLFLTCGSKWKCCSQKITSFEGKSWEIKTRARALSKKRPSSESLQNNCSTYFIKLNSMNAENRGGSAGFDLTFKHGIWQPWPWPSFQNLSWLSPSAAQPWHLLDLFEPFSSTPPPRIHSR